jgi:membrane protein DedA with SNARE-associated domain
MIIALVILSQGLALIGDLALAEFVDKHPAWLIALNPRNRNLALATNQLQATVYYTVGFLRLVASDPLYYLLGFWYGQRALAWVERKSRTYGPFVRQGESFFRKASYLFIFAAPNNIICALSAATGVRLRTFIILNLSGTVTRLVLIRQLGTVFESPIQRIIDFIAEYRIPVLIVSAIAVAWTIFGEFRGDNSEIRALTELTREDYEEDGQADANEDRQPSNNGSEQPEPRSDGSHEGANGDEQEIPPRVEPEPSPLTATPEVDTTDQN